MIKIQISNERIGKVDAILRNLTERGAGIEVQTDLKEGERVWISMKNLEPFCGTVAWSKQQKTGLQFDDPIDLTLLKITNTQQIVGEGIFNSAEGYHVFDRYKPVSDIKRPPLKPRK